MKLLFPDDAQGFFRPYSPDKGVFYACISFIVRFPLIDVPGDNNTPSASPIDLLHNPGDLLDEGLPKPRGEFLLSGSAYSPRGPVGSLMVTASVGRVHKELAVFGNRFFLGEERISDAEPFVVMPLTPKVSTPSSPSADPKTSENQDSQTALPNVEAPRQLMASKNDRFRAEGFGPLAIDSLERTPFLGTFDDAWFETRWPHLPVDGRPDYFQMARQDQQNAGYWVGNESILLKNLHPNHPVLDSKLPGLRGRLFGIRKLDGGDERFEEIQTHLDTVWLFPETLTGALVYHGVTQVKDSRASDLPVVLGRLEAISEPLVSVRDCYEQNKDTLKAALADETLVKDRSAEDDYKALDQLLSGELTTEALAALVHEKRGRLEQLLKEQDLSEETLIEFLKLSPQTRPLAEILLSEGSFKGLFDALEKELPARTKNEAQGAAPLLETDAVQPSPQESRLPEGVSGAPLTSEAQSAWLHRTTVLKMMETGADCTYMDFAGANFSGLDLSGMNFSRALLSGARFVGAKLVGCRFDEAFLNGANFQHSKLEKATFSYSSLGEADFTGSKLTGSIFDHADCSQTNFSEALMDEVSCKGTLFSGAKLPGLNVRGFLAAGAQFVRADLTSSSFNESDLNGADFSSAHLIAARFSHSHLIKADFSFAKVASAVFSDCDLSEASGSKGSDFRDAQFIRTKLDRVGWMGGYFNKAQILDSSAIEADFSDADLRDIKISRSVARQFLAVRSLLVRALIEDTDMMEGTFNEADFHSAYFRRVNLYGSVFMDVERGQATFDACNLKTTIFSD